MREVIGWRAWRIGRDGQSLVSPFCGERWAGGILHAQCGARGWFDRWSVPHDPPGRNCGCGVWATREIPSPWLCGDPNPWGWAYPEDVSGHYILGLVQLWGTVAVHGTEGWRGEHGRVVALWGEPQIGVRNWHKVHRAIAQIGDVLGVPVVDPRRPGWQAVLREFGAPSIDWLQPTVHEVQRDLVHGWWEAHCTCGWQAPILHPTIEGAVLACQDHLNAIRNNP